MQLPCLLSLPLLWEGEVYKLTIFDIVVVGSHREDVVVLEVGGLSQE